MKTIWKSSLIIVVLSLVLAGCGNQTSAQPVEQGPILIGSVLNTTGIQAPLDAPGLKGAQLAVEELNKQGGILGREVKLLNIDGQSDPEVVKNAAEELVAKGAAVLVAPCDFDFGSPVSKVAQRAGIVAISTCASSPLYSSTVLGDKQFTLSMWNTTMGAAAAEYAYKDRGWKTVYVVTDDFISYTTSLSQYFIEHFKNLGGTVISEDHYTQGDGDFSEQLARIQALDSKPDFLYVSSYMPDLNMIIQTLRDAGINLPIMGGDSYDDPGFFEALGPKYGNDIIFVTHSWMGAEATQDMSRFLQLYQKKYGTPPETSFVATGWDVIMVFAQAMEQAKTTDGADVAKAMENREFTLLTGKLTWSSADKGHEPDIEAALVQLQSGKPSFIGWGKPENIPAP
ncbi:MAG TPA: ABC transporter substrate-binding protein, partial [Anaerolineales bacterium]|nr:ABC transporter substrate-binding protein [Anaerolineales bacterium]